MSLTVSQLVGFNPSFKLQYYFIYLLESTNAGLNIRTLANSLGYSGSSEALITVAVGYGVVLGAPDTSTPALTTGTFPGGVQIYMNQGGLIIGAGGNGGAGGTSSSINGTAGAQGGPAFQATVPIKIANAKTIPPGKGGGGNIAGIYGGSGGGGGGGYFYNISGLNGGGGGGGAGAVPGAGNVSSTYPGSNGSTYGGGVGGGAGPGAPNYGGNGGTPGQNGYVGGMASQPYDTNIGNGGPGGSVGYALLGSSFITFTSYGTVQGLIA